MDLDADPDGTSRLAERGGGVASHGPAGFRGARVLSTATIWCSPRSNRTSSAPPHGSDVVGEERTGRRHPPGPAPGETALAALAAATSNELSTSVLRRVGGERNGDAGSPIAAAALVLDVAQELQLIGGDHFDAELAAAYRPGETALPRPGAL
jgi:hypothetical protein